MKNNLFIKSFQAAENLYLCDTICMHKNSILTEDKYQVMGIFISNSVKLSTIYNTNEPDPSLKILCEV